MPFSFLFLLCVHPEVSCAKGPCSEDLALAMGGATCCNASTPANRRESRRPTPSSSSRQIRARVLCQMGGIVLLALLLGQGTSGTKAIACPTLRILLSVTSSLLPSPLGFHLLPPQVRPQASHSFCGSFGLILCSHTLCSSHPFPHCHLLLTFLFLIHLCS